MVSKTTQVILASRPAGMPEVGDFSVSHAELSVLDAGQIRINVLYLSIDPYMRSRLSEEKNYAEPVSIFMIMLISEQIPRKN